MCECSVCWFAVCMPRSVWWFSFRLECLLLVAPSKNCVYIFLLHPQDSDSQMKYKFVIRMFGLASVGVCGVSVCMYVCLRVLADVHVDDCVY